MTTEAQRPWREVTHGIVRKFEVAAATGGRTVFNATGSAAVAKIIKKMADIIDDEIERRASSEIKPVKEGE